MLDCIVFPIRASPCWHHPRRRFRKSAYHRDSSIYIWDAATVLINRIEWRRYPSDQVGTSIKTISRLSCVHVTGEIGFMKGIKLLAIKGESERLESRRRDRCCQSCLDKVTDQLGIAAAAIDEVFLNPFRPISSLGRFNESGHSPARRISRTGASLIPTHRSNREA